MPLTSFYPFPPCLVLSVIRARLTVNVDPEETLATFKERLERLTNVPVAYQKLVGFRRYSATNDVRLSELGLHQVR